MSNWTKNKITITGKIMDLWQLEKEVKGETDFDFKKIDPGYEGTEYAYRIGIDDFNLDGCNGNGELIITFHTRWVPPFKIFEPFKEKYPHLQFIFQWRQEEEDYSYLHTYGANDE